MPIQPKMPLIDTAQSETSDPSARRGQAMSGQTAQRLQILCDDRDEAFDSSLTESQALRRIAALESK